MPQFPGDAAIDSSRDSRAGAADGGVAAAGAPASGAPPSNRAPDSCNQHAYRLLSRHVDSLDLSYPGLLRPPIAKELARLKTLAQSREDHERASAQISLAGHLFSVQDKGGGHFSFVLRGDWFKSIALCASESGKLPVAVCQIRNAALMANGPKLCVEALQTVISELADISGSGTVSRLDLAADFVTTANLEDWDRKAWVTRIRAKHCHAVGEEYTGWAIGTHADPSSLGLYNKTLEVEKSGKSYMYEVWDRADWAPWDAVWRAEARFRREYLQQFNLKTLPETLAALPALWDYFLSNTLRLKAPSSTDETRSRWDDHPLWTFLRSIHWGSPFVSLCRLPTKSGAPSDQYLGKHFAALLTSCMGRDGLDEPDDAISILRRCALEWEGRRSGITGLTAEESLIERARAKGRDYGTMDNRLGGTQATPLTQTAAERAYRTAARGE